VLLLLSSSSLILFWPLRITKEIDSFFSFLDRGKRGRVPYPPLGLQLTHPVKPLSLPSKRNFSCLENECSKRKWIRNKLGYEPSVLKELSREKEGPKRKFKGVILSGTFSPIHVGHVKLFETAFELSDKVFIGLTTDSLAQRKNPPPANYSGRKQRLVAWLKSKGIPKDRYEIIPISDVFGFSLEPKVPVESIIATEETIDNVERINAERKRKGLKKLEPVIVDLVRDETGEKVASRKIRAKTQDARYAVSE
jgi:pantetheine-phosphate adenylyltransferase